MKNITKIMGIVLAILLASGCSMKSMMVEERVSPYGLEETISKIQENAKAIGWVSPGVKNMNKSIAKHGGADIDGQVRIVELCNAEHASNILSTDAGRYAAVMMPCAIAVYTKSDGKTYVTNMRAGLMGSMMGGVVADVMEVVDVDQKKILAFLE
jgi:uncharacterized protein (DUF302 family)